MKKALQSVLLAGFVTFACSPSCAQNGPTQPLVKLTWTNSTPPSGETLSFNNVYRCTQVGGTACTPAPPAIFTSTAPITSYADASVSAGATYNYAVTETAGITESAYSNVVAAAVPTAPAAPSLQPPTMTGKNEVLKNKPGELVASVQWIHR